MKKSSIWLWQLAGLTFAVAFGSLLHFLYDWTGSIGVAPFSAVNESTWEHMKIFFFPALIFALFQARYFRREYACYWWIKLMGTACALVLIPVLFYTYNGAFGKSPDWLNVLFFFLAAAGGYALEGWFFTKKELACKSSVFPLTLFFVIAVAFVIFTFLTPRVPLFLDPTTGTYGLGKR